MQTKGVRGQKMPRNANVICERSLSAYRILPIGIIRIGKITLSAKGITDEITDNHPTDICSVIVLSCPLIGC